MTVDRAIRCSKNSLVEVSTSHTG